MQKVFHIFSEKSKYIIDNRQNNDGHIWKKGYACFILSVSPDEIKLCMDKL